MSSNSDDQSDNSSVSLDEEEEEEEESEEDDDDEETQDESEEESDEDEPKKKKMKQAEPSYVLFCKERRKALIEANPKAPRPHITKLLGAEWSALTKEEKQKYIPV
jgi:hypothetical protein